MASSQTDLETIGEQYYRFRSELMSRNNQGLTSTYNRFHDPNESDPGILTLRKLHDEMDRAVLAAYGWDDVLTECAFFAEFPTEDDKDDSAERDKTRKIKFRYRWH